MLSQDLMVVGAEQAQNNQDTPSTAYGTQGDAFKHLNRASAISCKPGEKFREAGRESTVCHK